jgi:hypothetical protein
MAKWTTRKKFDAADISVSDAPKKVYQAIWNDATRRAIQSITNRVLHTGQAGTATSTYFGFVGTGSTCGAQIIAAMTVAINGRVGTAYARDNMRMPDGTQAVNTWVKYLISTGFGTSGTITMGNEGASSTAARLPNLPDGHVAIGYMEYNTTSGAYGRLGGGTAGAYNILGFGGVAPSTCGTHAFTHLVHMPYDEA